MKEFIKVFFIISALAAAFVYGRNYGEKSFRESPEYRGLIKANEDLNFSKNELENIKAKFQNIADSANTKKTDELLAQILNVFLVDLGLRLQNKIEIAPNPPAAATENTKSLKPKSVETKKISSHEARAGEFKKYKNIENKIINSSSVQAALAALHKFKANDINYYLNQDSAGATDSVEFFLGHYRGSFKYINGKRFGSLYMKNSFIDEQQLEIAVGLFGEDGKGQETKSIVAITGKREQHKNPKGLIVKWKENAYFQVFKLNQTGQLVGNYYETLPNGTAKTIGFFVLSRVDQL